MKTTKNVLILGHGEIGKSIEKLYDDTDYKVHWKDIDESSKDIEELYKEYLHVMYVCIPFTDEKQFHEAVANNMSSFEPELTIITSTVPVGTTKDIDRAVEGLVAHSPVMGVHPNLTESIRTFKKIIGANSVLASLHTQDHFSDLGVTTIPYSSSNESEAAKLLSTSYYGWNIFFMRAVHDFCEENKLDFDEVYTFTNEIYNEGYKKMGMEFVRRPVLKYMKGKTGGHCVMPNWNLLKKYNNFKLADVAVELEKNATT